MMTIRNATLCDLNGIMLVEKEAFIPQIQESRSVFEQRLSAYPTGFFVLEENTDIAGYFSSELWNEIPNSISSFALGHSAAKAHIKEGNILYISSVALLNKYRGKGLGEKLFTVPITDICTHNSTIKKVVLLVNEVWQGAYHLYKKAGFIEYDRLDHFFPTETDRFTTGILMSTTVPIKSKIYK